MTSSTASNQNLIRTLLQDVQPRIGSLADRPAQDEFLRSQIRDRRLQHETVATLRTKLSNAVSKNRREDHPTVSKPVTEHLLLFEARSILQEAYLTKFGFVHTESKPAGVGAKATSAASSPRSKSTTPASVMKRKVDEAPPTGPPSNRRTEGRAEATDRNGDRPTVKSVPKVPAISKSVSQSDTQPAASHAKSSEVSMAAKVQNQTRTEAQKLAEEVERLKRQLNEEKEKTAAHARENAQLKEQLQIDKPEEERSVARAKDIEEKLEQKLFDKNAEVDKVVNYATEHVFGKSYQQAMRENQRFENMYVARRMGLAGDMEKLHHKARQRVFGYWRDRGLNDDAPMELVETPGPRLKALYQQMLGDVDWRQKLVGILELPKLRRGQYRPDCVLISLIAAAVYKEIFCKRSPFNLEDRAKKALGSQFERATRTADGHRLVRIMEETQLHMSRDKAFQDGEVTQYASQLARRLAITLAPHLDLLNKDTAWSTDVRAEAVDPSAWLNGLSDIFKEALIIKTQVETYGRRHTFEKLEFVWLKHGDPMEAGTAILMDLIETLPQEIMLTYWPGIRVTAGEKSIFDPKVQVLSWSPRIEGEQ